MAEGTKGDSVLDSAVNQWLLYDKNPKTAAMIQEMRNQKDVEALKKCFSSRMEFGTAGLRSAMGPGISCMNDLTIIQTTQGFCKYLEVIFENLKERGVVIGYDARAHPPTGGSSKRFATLAATVFMSRGVPVYLFSDITPTPFVPFTVSQLGLCAGIMVTASHNPKQDNGYKVYWDNGAQIVSPHDKGIAKAIEENLEPWPESWNTDDAQKNSLLKDPYQNIFTEYFKAIQKHCRHREINKNSEVKIVHTSVHGVGHIFVQEAFKSFELHPPYAVEEQKNPDPEFPTVKYPNPEEGEGVLTLSFALADKEGATVVLANDPDADRLALAEKQPSGSWRVFTGNELGALLGWWMFYCWKQQSTDGAVKNLYMLASTVSSKILRAIAVKEGFHFEETLTGFKWMGNRARVLLDQGKTVLFAFEEAIGYMCSTSVLDKDGVSAAAIAGEMVSYLATKNITASQQLTTIFNDYGYHISKNSYFICHDQVVIRSMFERLRNYDGQKDSYPTECGRFSITAVRDLTTGYDSNQPDNKAILPTSRSSQMITFTFSNGGVATMRTSGTEPKIKYYTELCTAPGNSDVTSQKKELDELVDAIIEHFFQPQKNKLQPKPHLHRAQRWITVYGWITCTQDTMDGLFFEVKPRARKPPVEACLHSNHRSCPSLLTLSSSPVCSESFGPQRTSSWGDVAEEEIQYRLQLIDSVPVHPLTSMPMLPWVVADIMRSKRGRSSGKKTSSSGSDVLLCVSASLVRCVSVSMEGIEWHPLRHTVLFECRPHQVTKLLHNSQEPSSFGFLIKTSSTCACYVFQCHDTAQDPNIVFVKFMANGMKARLQLLSLFNPKQEPKNVPEIISTLRHVGKSSARNDDLSTSSLSGGHNLDEKSLNNSSASSGSSLSGLISPTTFAKKFEVLFCGRVSVAHKKAPPALIDECIEKFSLLHGSGQKEVDGLERALSIQYNGPGATTNCPQPSKSTKKPVLFTRDPSFPSLQALDENGLSPEISNNSTADAQDKCAGIQPTSLLENRTMLFTVGRSQIYLVSPDTKKVAMEKSFREISFCSQGIRHVDHFGFICRETVDGGNFHFICYVFQCADEVLVDEIMLTLKQAFSVAAMQQNAKTQSQQCDSCPMQQLHKLCERIEGLHPSKTKLELQRHLATLNNNDQASVFESTMRARPRGDQEENELIMASLRHLYEDRQKHHHHSLSSDSKVVHVEAPGPETQQQSTSRLEQLKSRAKRSLTESLEGIWKGSSKSRSQKENSEGRTSSSDLSTIDSSPELLPDPQLRPNSPLKCHNSTGDLKQVEGSLTSTLPLDTPCSQGFRRRASTYSHPPTPTLADHVPVLTITGAPHDSASKPKLVRHYSVSTDSPHQSNDVAALSTPVPMQDMGESPMRGPRHSWRQQIFLRVATPQKGTEANGRGGDLCLDGDLVCSGPAALAAGELCMRPVPEEQNVRSREQLRELWRKAILQQILLQRMDRENQKLQVSENNLQNKRLKLDYEEITPCLKDVTLVWEKMLGTHERSKVKFDSDTVHAAVTHGVPRQHRGEIWKLLSEQFLLRQTVRSRPPANDTPYKELLKRLTSQQHAILIDLGRTFPTHPYFQAQLGAGQLSLYNLLKAYSLLDPEVGYCQGLSFIAGVLLLHMGEEEAFNMLKFLMYDMGLRKQYRPDMTILQIQMYQLSRLLHDYHRDLYTHLEQQEIGPSLYATPWFLTVFASHFPLGFVARVFDMLFLQGSEVIFKVALSLLGSHKPLILQHDSLESIVDFIKTTLPNLGLVQMEKTINQVCEMDLSKQLQAYEVEYHVLQDELLDTPPTFNQQQRSAQLERTNQSLRQQNLDLLEELQVSQARVGSLESRVEALVQADGRLREQVSGLEQEKQQLLCTVSQLQDLLHSLGIHTSADGQTLSPANVDSHNPGCSPAHPLALPEAS
uniref:TBC1 domain family member 4 n=1 Tax=Knipowitschia caucasica TaxID=637954 RepID=A0AAV2LHI4_KNICA